MSIGIGRVSTLQFMQMNRDFISRSTVSLQQAGQELSTGRRADLFADLGPKAAASLTLRAREDDTQAYIISNSLLEGRLQAQLESVDSVRNQVSSVLETVLANASTPLAGAETLQIQSRSALEITISQLNITFNGEALFGGTRSGAPPLTQFTNTNPTTGLSPQDVINSVLTGPPTSIAEVQSMVAELDAIFSSTSANPLQDFEATFYTGTPATDTGGNPMPRISAQIEPGLTLNYGLQANDEPLREIMKGFAMLTAFDVSDIADPDVYIAWMAEVSQVLGDASLDALGMSAEIGFRQQIVEQAQGRLESLSMVHQTQLSELEGVDPFEAATRMTTLETQLRASYEVTAQLRSLTILNYL